MTAAPVEHTCPEPQSAPRPLTLLEQADKLTDQLPGYRVEILGGVLTVTPPPDGAHARALSRLRRPFAGAGLDGGETELLEGVGLWLPDGPEDFAVPDLCVIDADFEDHLVDHNCYDPVSFRLVLEVTSGNYHNDLQTKVVAYGNAKVPVYVIVDRKHNRLHVLTEPIENGYGSHRLHAPGQQVTLPESLGAEVTLDVTEVLSAAATVTPQH
ncbi:MULTISPECIES: Uma2 family endonuclease [unclassified Streptomyces]|uniref:Uma2 family endonuclease n=1 Tax=Streptomyces sp. NBC_00119 TaxID=2975659 RepID=A0AAU1U5W7_9ACTN|nr:MULTISPECIES: Uma2 family endonuclease [unclassified Streptomyces]MCX4643449.1 Uma2 family endonuclease [Streptomyces sp. NBC_01446]MCX5324572.1 Uma2 family endonuclease [Streptomyces sp. NBC_00120]